MNTFGRAVWEIFQTNYLKNHIENLEIRDLHDVSYAINLLIDMEAHHTLVDQENVICVHVKNYSLLELIQLDFKINVLRLFQNVVIKFALKCYKNT